MRRVRLSDLDPGERRRLIERSVIPDPSIRSEAAAIVAEVRRGGDSALRTASQRFGGGPVGDTWAVEPHRMAEAWERLDSNTRDALTAAAEAIRSVHLRQVPVDDVIAVSEGVRIERRWSPLARVGVYVPGGNAAYPSTLLMGVIPAKVAGVSSIVVACPSDRSGMMPEVVLAAAAMAGVDELLVMGGAQAIAALAYGTETIEPVQKIVGPGNAWVTAAKLAVVGDCAIDLPAGPSEALVIADDTADPALVAIDLICQAEHGPDSPVVLVTADPTLAARVLDEVDPLLERLSRRAILDKSLSDHGLLVEADDLDGCIDFANEYAAEHVSIHTSDPATVAQRIISAGSVFVGAFSPESAGDYATGANHVLPTGGLAAAASPLGVGDFGSWRQVQHLTRSGLQSLLPTIISLADAEALDAHRLAATLRFPERAKISLGDV